MSTAPAHGQAHPRTGRRVRPVPTHLEHLAGRQWLRAEHHLHPGPDLAVTGAGVDVLVMTDAFGGKGAARVLIAERAAFTTPGPYERLAELRVPLVVLAEDPHCLLAVADLVAGHGIGAARLLGTMAKAGDAGPVDPRFLVAVARAALTDVPEPGTKEATTR